MYGFLLEAIVSLYNNPEELEAYARSVDAADHPIIQRRLQVLRNSQTVSHEDMNRATFGGEATVQDIGNIADNSRMGVTTQSGVTDITPSTSSQDVSDAQVNKKENTNVRTASIDVVNEPGPSRIIDDPISPLREVTLDESPRSQEMTYAPINTCTRKENTTVSTPYINEGNESCPPMIIDPISPLREVPPDNSDINSPKSQDTTDNQVGGNGGKPYHIEKTGERRFAKSVAVEKTYKVRFDNQWRGERVQDLRAELHQMFEDVIEQGQEGMNDNDLMRVIIRDNILNQPIVVPLQPADQMRAEKVMEKVENVIQSEENFAIDESFEVIVGSLHIPQGSGRRRLVQTTGPCNSIRKKTSMVMIVNEDMLCMARAIGVCYAKLSIVSDEDWKNIDSRKEALDILINRGQTSKYIYKNICKKNRADQKNLASKLCRMAKVSEDSPASLLDINKFENALKVRIAVIAASLGNKFIRVPSNDHVERPVIYLYMTEEEKNVAHYHSVVNVTGFFGNEYFCDTCFKPYKSRRKHSCETCCIVCESSPCPKTECIIICQKCNMTCRSAECYKRHQKSRPMQYGQTKTSGSPCSRYWRCPTCHKVIDKFNRNLQEKPHQCSEWFCGSCKEWVENCHRCYLYPEERKNFDLSMIFIDFEARQDTADGCGRKDNEDGLCSNCGQAWCSQYRHIPNFALAQTACSFCLDQSLNSTPLCSYCGSRCQECCAYSPKEGTYLKYPCHGTCGFRETIFKGDDTTDKFGQWLFNETHRNTTVVAHNAKSYDGYFLLEYLIKNSVIPNKLLFNGSKIMYMEVGRGLNIRLIDSLNFLPMKLAKMPSTFGLTELCKGYFPHFFNTKENQNYVGPYPDIHFYGDEYMKTDERDALLKWHKEKVDSGCVFDFKKEIENYCRSDVDILRKACLQFRQLLLEATGVDPFQYITIASVCMGVFKTMFLEERFEVVLATAEGGETETIPALLAQTGWKCFINGKWQHLKDTDYSIKTKKSVGTDIAQVPSGGYVQRDNFSKDSIEWLEYVQDKARREGKPVHIQHALNGGEKKIPGTKYKTDGYCAVENKVYEYNGCVWHGCKTCFPEDRRKIKHPHSDQSMEELYALTMIKKQRCLDLGYKYESIWEHEWLGQKISQRCVVGDIQERLNPRDAFFGGRTNACKLYYKACQGEKIKYVDFTSLYPWVNKYGKYPVGHPEIITSDFQPLESYFGIAKVKVLPPRGLYHSVLPFRVKVELLFPLCRTCAKLGISICQHNDEDRAMIATWCTPELQVAIEKVYRVLKIYEVYHFPQTSQYDSESKEGGIFAAYVNTFLKYKQESSGWPTWCKTNADKSKYLDEYFEKEGVRLDASAITANPGLRTLSKLFLNSLWGKFAQRLNLTQCKIVNEIEIDAFFQLLGDTIKRVKDFRIINEANIHLEWEHHGQLIPESTKTNIFIAAFTTCWARLKLYGLLDKLGNRILYFDTDSIVYTTQDGQWEPQLGDYLGELTDELQEGDFITEFVSGGPKNYTFTTHQNKQVCKVRGFSLNYANSQAVNFESVKSMIINDKTGLSSGTSAKRKRSDDTEPKRKKYIVTLNPTKIMRDKISHVVYTKREKKKYQIVYDKRVLLDDFDTVPYGF